MALNPDVLFIDDGDVLTSAGAASGLDVCLDIIRKDHGSEVANQVARMCVVPPWRDDGQAQYIRHRVPETKARGTATVRHWALENLHEPMTLADLAERSHMSLRTFARRFTEEVGMSPGRWLIPQRVERARHLLETTDLPVDEIAGQVGSPAARHYENTCTPPSASHHLPTGALFVEPGRPTLRAPHKPLGERGDEPAGNEHLDHGQPRRMAYGPASRLRQNRGRALYPGAIPWSR